MPAADTALVERSTPRSRHPRLHLRPATILVLAIASSLAGCHSRSESSREAAEAPPAAPVVAPTGSANTVHIDHPGGFTLVRSTAQPGVSTLNVTGSVQPDPSREVPVLSLANGRVVALHVGLGDTVRKGQLVLEVQSPDVATAFGTYLKAVADEHLTQTQLTRAQLLFSKGATSQSQLDVAENGERDARADLTAATQQLRILGVDPAHPSDTVRVYAPISGVVISQNTTAAGIAGAALAGTAGSLTIADLTRVWVVCDVYENDLATVHLGESAQIHLDAFPNQPRTGTISDIGSILDPSLRTAKVRIQVPNPDRLLRIGMFATAAFRGAGSASVVSIPETAILHLHDAEFVFLPTADQATFQRVAVHTGAVLANGSVAITSGLNNGQQIVANALELQNAADQ